MSNDIDLEFIKEMKEAEDVLDAINNCTCKIEVFKWFIDALKNGESIGDAITSALYEWDEVG